MPSIPILISAETVSFSNHVVECGVGVPLSGIAYTNAPPTMNYELSLEAMRAEGSDFFVALTIPVEANFCAVAIGGWGGCLCGISSVDYADATTLLLPQHAFIHRGSSSALFARVAVPGGRTTASLTA